MKRTMISMGVVAALAVLLASVPVAATVNTATGVDRLIGVFAHEPTANGWIQTSVNFRQQAWASSTDAAVTPGVDTTADGFVATYTGAPCYCYAYGSISRQAISPTAITMDPIGNSARVVATLTSNLGSHAFDVALTRPTAMYVSQPCTNGCSNAWFDPGTNQARADNYGSAALHRFGYSVAGVAGGLPLTTNGWASAWSGTSVTGVQGIGT